MKLTKLFIAVFACAGLLAAQEPVASESRPGGEQIRAQLKNLDNDSFEVRTKAMETLRAAGESARPELEAARKSDSLEVRTRAESLLKELDSKTPGRKGSNLKPMAPDEELRGGQQRTRQGQPRVEDFGDPQGYFDALRKWMAEMDKDPRFPRWVLPNDEEWMKEFSKDFGNHFTIIQPDGLPGGGSFSITQQKDGETMTFKNGPDGVVLKVQRQNEPDQTWEAKDVEEFKTKHPDVWEKYKPTEGTGLGFTLRSPNAFKRVAPGDRPTIIGPGQRLAPLGPPPPLASNRPLLGVTPSPVPPVLDRQLKLKGEGMVIDEVSPNSLASRLGIQELDVLIQINGQAIRERDDILRALSQKDGPATVAVKVVREGVTIDLTAPREAGK